MKRRNARRDENVGQKTLVNAGALYRTAVDGDGGKMQNNANEWKAR